MSYEDARKLSPPSRLRNFHNLLIEGLSYCNLATGKITKGIDNLDADLIQEAAELIELCGAMVQRASADPNW